LQRINSFKTGQPLPKNASSSALERQGDSPPASPDSWRPASREGAATRTKKKPKGPKPIRNSQIGDFIKGKADAVRAREEVLALLIRIGIPELDAEAYAPQLVSRDYNSVSALSNLSDRAKQELAGHLDKIGVSNLGEDSHKIKILNYASSATDLRGVASEEKDLRYALQPPQWQKIPSSLLDIDTTVQSAIAEGIAELAHPGKVMDDLDAATDEELQPFPWEPGGCGTLSEKDPNSERRLHLCPHYKVKNIHISPDWTSATWQRSPCGGWLISREPVPRQPNGRWFEVRIDEVVTDVEWGDGMGIGVAVHPSKAEKVETIMVPVGNYEGFAYETLRESWLLGYDGRARIKGISRFLQEKELYSPWPDGLGEKFWRPRDLRPGDVVGILSTPAGALLLFVNGDLRYFVKGCHMPWHLPLHVVVDLDGRTKSIRLLDPGKIPNNIEEILRKLRDADPARNMP
jgi:hypothetical protein